MRNEHRLSITIEILQELAGSPLDMADPVDRVVAAFYMDITDRRGFRQAWDKVDSDVRGEIVATWREIIREAMTEDWVQG